MSAASNERNRNDKIGGFPVEGLLGVGGMGEVYKVRDEAFDRELALKLSKRGGDEGDPALVRFVGEGRLIGQLQHPSIPPIYHLAQDEHGRWFYTMKRVRGRTLASVLKAVESDPKAREEWSLRRLLSTFVTICQAVAYAHSRGVIHRDLKPQNIMLGDFGEVYVMDWGLAKVLSRNLNKPESEAAAKAGTLAIPAAESEPTVSLSQADIAATIVARKRPGTAPSQALDDTLLAAPGTVPVIPGPTVSGSAASGSSEWGSDSDSELPIKPFKTTKKSKIPLPNAHFDASMTTEGDILGTPAYMAPEQARGESEQHDQRTDVYSLGVILWEILTGQPLRTGRNISDMVKAAMQGERPEFEKVARGRRVEPELKEACWKALEPFPKDRPPSVLELAQNIQNWIDGVRKWKLVHEVDFSKLPPSDRPPEGWHTHAGKWGIRDGALAVLEEGNSVLYLDLPCGGDVRVQLRGWVEPGITGELSVILAGPEQPSRREKDDGYVFQFGANNGTRTKLSRNGLDVLDTPGKAPIPGKRHNLLCEVVEGLLRLEVDGEEIFVQRDFFALQGSRVGLYGWPAGTRIQAIRVWAAGVPKQQSCLAVPDYCATEKNWEQALAGYERIMESHPGSAEADEALFKSGLCLIELKEFNKAESRFHALKDTPSAPLAWVGLSVFFERTENDGNAEKRILNEGLVACKDPRSAGHADLLLRAKVRNEVFGAGLKQALIQCHELATKMRLTESRQSGLRIIKENPQDRTLCAGLLIHLGGTWFYQGKFDEERHVYMSIIRDYPEQRDKSGMALYYTARSYHVEGRQAESRKVCQEILDSFKDFRWVCDNAILYIGRTYEVEKAWDKAIECFERNIRSFSDQPGNKAIAASHLGDLLLNAGRYQESIEAYERASLDLPKDLPEQRFLILGLARTLFKQGKHREAELAIADVLRNWGQIPKAVAEALVLKGDFLRWSERFSDAAVAYREVWERFPSEEVTLIASLWLALLDHKSKMPSAEFLKWARTLPSRWVFSLYQFERHVWSLVMHGYPGGWLRDDLETELTPNEALRRTHPLSRAEFQEMLDFRASIDPAWKPWASNPNPVEMK